MLALTHLPSPHMECGERTFMERAAISIPQAMEQHQAYCRMLERCGYQVETLALNRAYADCTFIEDTAIVLEEIAVVGSMGSDARRGELDGVETLLRQYRDVHRVVLPATLEGGDVLRIGRTLLVGLSSRTNAQGIKALSELVGRYRYRVQAIPVTGSLHLKTACTALPDEKLLVNPHWVDTRELREYATCFIPEEEPWGANVLCAKDIVCLSDQHVRTADIISRFGFEVATVDISQFAKAEGGVTCLSILLS